MPSRASCGLRISCPRSLVFREQLLTKVWLKVNTVNEHRGNRRKWVANFFPAPAGNFPNWKLIVILNLLQHAVCMRIVCKFASTFMVLGCKIYMINIFSECLLSESSQRPSALVIHIFRCFGQQSSTANESIQLLLLLNSSTFCDHYSHYFRIWSMFCLYLMWHGLLCCDVLWALHKSCNWNP